jgi:hypothetical protein
MCPEKLKNNSKCSEITGRFLKKIQWDPLKKKSRGGTI